MPAVNGKAVARHPWVDRAARGGYAARGVMYVIIGGLALLALIGAGGRVDGLAGALRHVLTGWLGVVLVVAMTVGLSAHAAWSLFQAFADPEVRRRERRSPDGGGSGSRAGYRFARLCEGVAHVVMVVGAVGLLTGRHGGGGAGGSNAGEWAAWLMAWPYGVWLVGAVGLGSIGFGAAEVWRAWRAKLDPMVSLSGVGPGLQRVLVGVSRFGIVARGLTFALVGAWLVVAAWDRNSRDAKGLGGAMQDLAARPYGRWLLGIIACGLIAYGVYEFLRAAYRKIGPGDG